MTFFRAEIRLPFGFQHFRGGIGIGDGNFDERHDHQLLSHALWRGQAFL